MKTDICCIFCKLWVLLDSLKFRNFLHWIEFISAEHYKDLPLTALFTYSDKKKYTLIQLENKKISILTPKDWIKQQLHTWVSWWMAKPLVETHTDSGSQEFLYRQTLTIWLTIWMTPTALSNSCLSPLTGRCNWFPSRLSKVTKSICSSLRRKVTHSCRGRGSHLWLNKR